MEDQEQEEQTRFQALNSAPKGAVAEIVNVLKGILQAEDLKGEEDSLSDKQRSQPLRLAFLFHPQEKISQVCSTYSKSFSILNGLLSSTSLT